MYCVCFIGKKISHFSRGSGIEGCSNQCLINSFPLIKYIYALLYTIFLANYYKHMGGRIAKSLSDRPMTKKSVVQAFTTAYCCTVVLVIYI